LHLPLAVAKVVLLLLLLLLAVGEGMIMIWRDFLIMILQMK